MRDTDSPARPNRLSRVVAKTLVFLASLTISIAGARSGFASTFSISQGSAMGSLSLAQASSTQLAFPGQSYTSDWAYTVRPGDTLHSLANGLLNQTHGWQDLLQHNHLESADAIHPGQVIKIPLSWLRQEPKPATALAVTGDVYYRTESSAYAALQSGTKLNVGDQVRAEQGHAVIELADTSIVRLAPHSSLTFDRLTQYGKTGMADTRMRLRKGSLSTDVHPLSDPHSRFEIETPSAVAAVRGTAFRLHTNSAGTRLEVTRGKVAFGNSFQQMLVPAGYGAKLGNSGSSQREQLPPEPKAPPSPGSTGKLPLTIKWQPVTQANAYQLNLFNTQTGAWERSERLSQPQVTFSDLNNGKYRVDLAAIDNNGLEGPAASVHFTIALQALAAQLQSPINDAKVGKGPVSFNWHFQGKNQQARVQVSGDPGFSNLAAQSPWLMADHSTMSKPLAPGRYYWRVKTRAGGSSRAASQVATFVVPGSLPEVHIITANYVNNQVRIFWRHISGVQKYRLQLSADANFTQIVREEAVASNTVALRLIPGRHYYVRIKPVSSGPLKSIWGPARELYVDK